MYCRYRAGSYFGLYHTHLLTGMHIQVKLSRVRTWVHNSDQFLLELIRLIREYSKFSACRIVFWKAQRSRFTTGFFNSHLLPTLDGFHWTNDQPFFGSVRILSCCSSLPADGLGVLAGLCNRPIGQQMGCRADDNIIDIDWHMDYQNTYAYSHMCVCIYIRIYYTYIFIVIIWLYVYIYYTWLRIGRWREREDIHSFSFWAFHHLRFRDDPFLTGRKLPEV